MSPWVSHSCSLFVVECYAGDTPSGEEGWSFVRMVESDVWSSGSLGRIPMGRRWCGGRKHYMKVGNPIPYATPGDSHID